jgi:hypothetical protein
MEFLKKNLSRVMGIASLLLVFGWVFSFFQDGMQESFVDLGLYLTKGLLYLLGLTIASLFVYNLIISPKLLIKTGIVLMVVIVIFLISYFLATDDVSTVKAGLDYTKRSLKIVGGLVGMTWTLIVLAGIGALTSELLKAFKNG